MSRRMRREFGNIRKRASGRYSASYVGPDGLRRFAGHTFATKADAQAWLALQQTQMRGGGWTDPALGRRRLGDYGIQWIAEHQLSSRTRDLYAGLFRLHIEPFLGNL